MCGLCGVLDSGHWSDGVASADINLRRVRALRAALLSQVLEPAGLRVRDCGAGGVLVSNRTGRSAMVSTICQFWIVVDSLGGAVDPLSPGYLAAIARE